MCDQKILTEYLNGVEEGSHHENKCCLFFLLHRISVTLSNDITMDLDRCTLDELMLAADVTRRELTDLETELNQIEWEIARRRDIRTSTQQKMWDRVLEESWTEDKNCRRGVLIDPLGDRYTLLTKPHFRRLVEAYVRPSDRSYFSLPNRPLTAGKIIARENAARKKHYWASTPHDFETMDRQPFEKMERLMPRRYRNETS